MEIFTILFEAQGIKVRGFIKVCGLRDWSGDATIKYNTIYVHQECYTHMFIATYLMEVHSY